MKAASRLSEFVLLALLAALSLNAGRCCASEGGPAGSGIPALNTFICRLSLDADDGGRMADSDTSRDSGPDARFFFGSPLSERAQISRRLDRSSASQVNQENAAPFRLNHNPCGFSSGLSAFWFHSAPQPRVHDSSGRSPPDL
jgi:hypothetical protein